ncbi:MAG: hypothetical protein V3W34_04455, partial [Phycisphaerae bacterium]
MPERFNRLKNADFAEGAKRPLNWNWWADSDAVRWALTDAQGGAGRDGNLARAVVISSDDQAATGYFAQRVSCKPAHWYRIEAVAACQCNGAADDGGAALWVRPETSAPSMANSEPQAPARGCTTHPASAAGPVRLMTVLRSAGPITMRSYYRTPPDAKAFELRIGLSRATGSVSLRSLLVISNIDPDVKSHPLALPPPTYAYRPPRKVRRVCVCDDSGGDRPAVTILRKRFGAGSVKHLQNSAFAAESLEADALIVAGSKAPRGIRSLAALERLAAARAEARGPESALAAGRVVIISLEAFAKLARCGLNVRTVVQPDDPLNAKIVWANFITRGFALHDMVPWASTADDVRVYRQRQFRRGAAVNKLCRDHGYEVVMTAQTDSDSTSDHPICLYKPVAGGAVIVFDVDPLETSPTTCGESNLAVFMLLNMLGADQAAVGQYSVPMDT